LSSLYRSTLPLGVKCRNVRKRIEAMGVDVTGGLVSEVRADTRCKSWFEKHIGVPKITLLNVSSRIHH